MHSTTDRSFNTALQSALAFLDTDAKKIVLDLTRKLNPQLPFSHMRAPDGGKVARVQAFSGVNGCVMFAHHLRAFPNFIKNSLREVERGQFRTEEENKLFCRGTERMLDLLNNYRFRATTKAIIAAVPDFMMRGGHENKEQAYIEEWHLGCVYNDERRVNVMVLWELGGIHYCFEEKIKPSRPA